MTFSVLFQILRSRWISFVVTVLLVLGVTGLLTWTASKKYTASASVVLDIRNDPIAGGTPLAAASPNYLMTQVDIIQSQRVAGRVVKALRLAEVPALRERWLETTKGVGDFEKWLQDLMLAGLDVRPSRGSNVVTLLYEGSDPKFVAGVANAFVDAYLETVLEMRIAPARDYAKLFDENAKSLRDKLEQAQTRLSEYQQKSGLVVTDERLDIETQRLNELNAQLTALQAAAADSRSRQAQAQTQADRMLEVTNSPLVSGLRADLSRQEAQLEQLTARLGDNHPAVREARSGLAELRSRLDQEVKRAQSGMVIANDVNESRVAQARAALEAQRAKVLKLRELRDEAAVLAREVDNAQRAYEGVLGRLTFSNLEAQANQTSVIALERASAPNRPSSPRVLLNFLLGVVIALVAGIAVVWARESGDRRVRAVSDLEEASGIPLMATMPAYGVRRRWLQKWRDRRGRSSRGGSLSPA